MGLHENLVIEQEVRQRRNQYQSGQHVPDEHEGQQQAHVGLELDGRPHPGHHADRERHAHQGHRLAGELNGLSIGILQR
ncbi:hypothetical protein D9M70_640860 [compost metagenome]